MSAMRVCGGGRRRGCESPGPQCLHDDSDISYGAPAQRRSSGRPPVSHSLKKHGDGQATAAL